MRQIAAWRRLMAASTLGSSNNSDSSAARGAVSGLLLRVNPSVPGLTLKPLTISQLCAHFERHELARENTWRTFSTKKIYKAYLRRWVIPQWGDTELAATKAIHVECWLRQLPLARSSCAKIRNLMSVLFNHACRYELFDQNPIRLVRQSAKRRMPPTVLTADEIKKLLEVLAIRERTLVLLAGCTGLRQSELFGRKWSGIDFPGGTMNVTRSVVYGVAGPCKTESSQKPVPLHPLLADALQNWRTHAAYKKPSDWVFASKRHRGQAPLWGQAILRRYVRPAAERAGIERHFGWHTFRHTYSTLLRSVGTEFKVMQELLRHSTL
jgi:integrase